MKLHLFYYLSTLVLLFVGCNSSSDALSEWKEQSNFAIKDTAAIMKFKISDTENNAITITREEDNKNWKIEGTPYLAQVNNVKLIMETFYRLRVKRDVPTKNIPQVLSALSSRSKKVEIFNKGDKKPFKTWFIGGATMDHEGTFMLLQTGSEKSPVPFVMYKPGVYASMDVRFFTCWIDWRASYVFRHPDTRNIEYIEVNFNQDSTSSYKISKGKNNTVALFDGNNNTIRSFDSIQVKHYFSHYKKIHYNKLVQKPQDYIDSVFNSPSFYTIKLKDNSGKFNEVKIWKIKSSGLSDWDPEYGYIRMNGENELFRIQYYSWDILFKPLSYFLPKKS